MFLDVLVWISYVLTLYIFVYWILLWLDGEARHVEPLPKRTPKKWPGLTVIIPAYNEERSLAKTVASVLNLDYPRDALRIIIVDDGSTDTTPAIGAEYASSHDNITYLRQKNAGKATALNNGLKLVTTPFFACLDADSFVHHDAAKQMIMSFEADQELQICTPVMRVTEPRTFVQRFQRLEYLAAMLLVRMMAAIDSNYVAPGPFSTYRTQTIRDLGGFDEHNLVEDQEIAYRVQERHGKIRQAERAFVDTIAPSTFPALAKQRNRWMKGTLLNLLKYRRLLFNPKYGDFGSFMMPITLVSFALAVIAIIGFVAVTVWPLMKHIYRLWLIGFDIAPYLSQWEWSFTLLDPSYPSLMMIWLLLGISVFLLFMASKAFDDAVGRYGRFYIIPYFFIYFLVLSVVAVQVLFEVAVGKKQRW